MSSIVPSGRAATQAALPDEETLSRAVALDLDDYSQSRVNPL